MRMKKRRRRRKIWTSLKRRDRQVQQDLYILFLHLAMRIHPSTKAFTTKLTTATPNLASSTRTSRLILTWTNQRLQSPMSRYFSSRQRTSRPSPLHLPAKLHPSRSQTWQGIASHLRGLWRNRGNALESTWQRTPMRTMRHRPLHLTVRRRASRLRRGSKFRPIRRTRCQSRGPILEYSPTPTLR